MDTTEFAMVAQGINAAFIAANAAVDFAMLAINHFGQPLVISNKLSTHGGHINAAIAQLIICRRRKPACLYEL